MKKFQVPLLLTVITTSILALAAPPAALSEEGTCYLEAVTDVYIEVYDLDREGNHGEMIWNGRIEAGDAVLLKAPHARFRYKYNSEPDQKQALTVGPDQWCNGENNVTVP